MTNALKKAQLWLFSYAWAWALCLVFSLKRERMSHNSGITAKGRIRITKTPAFPAHDFFQPGREFKCRVRHASASYEDDTITQVRAVSLKFADSDYDSPLDLELNTGTISLFWTARNFAEFAQQRRHRVNELAYWNYYDKYPRGLLAAEDGIRKYPASFARMYYHSQTATRFVGKDGVLRYAKYRLVPADGGPETGLMTKDELRNRWKEALEPGETRAPDYLRQELVDRLARGPVHYVLQIQLHTPQPDDSPELLNCNVAWDEATHPHMDLATVELESILPRAEGNQMRFSLLHHPPSLGILPSEHMDDYNSLNYMRARSSVVKEFRVYLTKAWGPREAEQGERPETVRG
ncbi:catalase family protein [Archangium violaceum]|uniref:hypothetical protein n=1 Tax=Archangium violaceum TaxID=83451 RepID=UPI0036DA369B